MAFIYTILILLNSISLFSLLLPVLSVHGMEMPEQWGTVNCENFDTGESVYNMMTTTLFEDRDICCGKEKFYRGVGSAQLKYFNDCNIEPKNETMSFQDSVWTMYDCLIKKTIGSQELTQDSFNELQAKNLSDSKRSAVLSKVKDVKATPIAIDGNVELQPIKTYWANYFEAELQVCTESSTMSPSIKESLTRFWDPSLPCKSEKFPKLVFLPVTLAALVDCATTFETKYPAIANVSSPMNGVIILPCAFIQIGMITEEDLNNADFNFEALFTKAMPKFFSKSLKEQILSNFRERNIAKYSGDLKSGSSAGIQEIAKEMMKGAQKMLGDLSNADKKDMYVNIVTMFEILREAGNTYENICHGPPGPNGPPM